MDPILAQMKHIVMICDPQTGCMIHLQCNAISIPSARYDLPRYLLCHS